MSSLSTSGCPRRRPPCLRPVVVLGLLAVVPAASPAASVAPVVSAREGAATLSGTVGAPGGIVVDDAIVEVTELHREVPVDASGTFRVENVPAGTYLIQITSLDGPSVSQISPRV